MLKEALASIEVQTYPVSEIHVMEGPQEAWERVNMGVRKSKSDAFFVLCDDDLIRPSFVEETVKVMERWGVDIVSTPLENFGEQTGIHGCGEHPFVTALIRRSMFDKVGGYDPKAGLAADADFYYSAFEQGARWEKLGEPLFLYRVHGQQWSQNDLWSPYMDYIFRKHKLKQYASL